MDNIKAFAKECFSNTPGSHGWEHTERVHRLCIRIGQVEKADLEVLAVAAYLHDVGRCYQDKTKGRVCHGEKGAEIAAAFLDPYGLPGEKRDNIIHCIRSHRFRVARTFLFAVEVGAKLHNPNADPADTAPYTEEDTGYREYVLKLSKIKERMLTQEGRRMAEERHAFMAGFFDRFLDEYDGKK
ncbi:MAG: HD domain-containing protein [Deltaproteobacteria bacterium]